MKRSIIKLLCAAMLVSAVPPGALAAEQPSSWAAEPVAVARAAGILPEELCSDYTSPITREDFCTIAYNILKARADVKPCAENDIPFTDTKNTAVGTLAAEGIIKGKSETQFAPDDSLTRKEAAAILYRLARRVKIDVSKYSDTDYKDLKDFSYLEFDSILAISGLGIMTGTAEDTFSPKGTFTREQAVTALMRLNNIESIPSDPLPKTEPETFADRLNAQMPEDKNYTFSPLSVKMALALAANGAEDESLEELKTVMGIDDLDAFNEKAKKIIDTYSQSELLKLSIANSIWINSDKTKQKFSKSYSDKIKKFYNGGAFTANDSNAVKKVNDWVSESTNGKIESIIDTPEFWSMLVNAVYFKGRWEFEFYKNATDKGAFTDRSGNKTEKDFMHMTTWLNYLDINSIRAVQLPYKSHSYNPETYEPMEMVDANVSMYILLADYDGINVDEFLSSHKDDFNSEYIDLSIPKFSIDYSEKLTDAVKHMGADTVLDVKKAKFSPMFDSGNMYIDSIVHKTHITVDEEGTEAAAVTLVGMIGAGLPSEPIEFTADKPFTFVIRDDTNDEILFMGEYAF